MNGLRRHGRQAASRRNGDYRVLEFLELLERIGYEHFLVLEYHPEYDALLRGDASAGPP